MFSAFYVQNNITLKILKGYMKIYIFYIFFFLQVAIYDFGLACYIAA